MANDPKEALTQRVEKTVAENAGSPFANPPGGYVGDEPIGRQAGESAPEDEVYGASDERLRMSVDMARQEHAARMGIGGTTLYGGLRGIGNPHLAGIESMASEFTGVENMTDQDLRMLCLTLALRMDAECSFDYPVVDEAARLFRFIRSGETAEPKEADDEA